MAPSIPQICEELELDAPKCRTLKSLITEFCTRKKPKTKRERSKWQECIASRRKGKKFDPQAIKELAKEYRAGTCP